MNPFAGLADRLERAAAPSTTETELSRYRTAPELYARERLGVEFLPWQLCLVFAIANLWHRITPEMADLAHMQNPGRRKIAVSSGQKTGKTLAIVVVGLWFFECFPAARALFTAAIGDQIRAVIWKELKDRVRNAPHRPAGEVSEDPARGLISPDESREIRGFTGRAIEAVAGISGNLAYFIDEASHIEQKKFEAVDGNTAGEGDLGAPIVLTSQPTRSEGPFFDAFHAKAEFTTTMVFDSEEIAEWMAQRGLRVPGIATRAKTHAWREEYGEDSPFYQVRVLGKFLQNETGRIITMHLIEGARLRWRLEDEDPEDTSELSIGFDPAGPGDEGDELGFSAVRGFRCLELFAIRGLDDDKALDQVYGLLAKHRRSGERPRVMIDAEGQIGSRLLGRLQAEAELRSRTSAATSFEVFAVRTSSKYVRIPDKFVRVRDEVWWNLAQWMTRGAIPQDHKLEAELYAPRWIGMPDGKVRATPKKDLRAFLGRSTDRADCLALAVDPPRVARLGAPEPAPPQTRQQDGRVAGIDAYGWERSFR